MIETLKELFIDWRLQTWAEILEVVAAFFGVWTFFYARFIKKEVKELKDIYSFEKRINDHIKALTKITTDLNNNLSQFDQNIVTIKTLIGVCQSELESLTRKITTSKEDLNKIKELIKFIKQKKKETFITTTTTGTPIVSFWGRKKGNQIVETTDKDIWHIYQTVHEIVRNVENLKKDKQKSLKI